MNFLLSGHLAQWEKDIIDEEKKVFGMCVGERGAF